MRAYVSTITLGVSDVKRARQFYSEGLDWPIHQEHDGWVCFGLGDGSCALGLYSRDALARDVGVPADGEGFRGLTLSHIVGSGDRVDALMTEAARAGARIIMPPQAAPWGGYFGYLADPDG